MKAVGCIVWMIVFKWSLGFGQCVADSRLSTVVCAFGNVVSTATWNVPYGTPSCFGDIDASDATSAIWMWSYSSTGECILTPYNFISGHTYRICLRFNPTATHPTAPGELQIKTAVSGATGVLAVNALPTIYSVSLGSYPLNVIQTLSFVYTPSTTENYLVIRPWQTAAAFDASSQSSFVFDDLYIMDLGHAYNFSAFPSPVCPGDFVYLSVTPEGCEGEDISFWKDGMLICSGCSSTSDMAPMAGSVLYEAIVNRGIPGAPCKSDTFATTVQIIPCPLGPNSVDLRKDCGSSGMEGLSWVTENQDVGSFIIYGSNDGAAWTSIEETENADVQYHPLRGVDRLYTYYMVKSFDLDGHEIDAAIISSECELDDEPSVYPNPTTGKFYINLGKSLKGLEVQVLVHGLAGNEIARLDLGKEVSDQEIPVQLDVSPGVYYITLIPEFGRTKQLKLTTF